jgi:hypothetical protein
VLDEEPPALCSNPMPSDYFQFLDDTCSAKRQPSHVDRGLRCPTADPSATIALADGSPVSYQPPHEAPVVQPLLAGLGPDELTMTAVLIRRVNGVPHFRYLSTGDHDVPFQPWSTTKFLAAANAAARLRVASGYTVGLGASVSGHALGDLVSSMHSYDDTPFSSNALAAYFHDVGGRAEANDLIHGGWLMRPVQESFGGNYGAAPPALGYSFAEPSGATVSISPDTSTGFSNHLSSFTLAEALKRLVLHRELPDQRLPGVQWSDLEVLFYGTGGSSSYGHWGGMAADTAIYLQTGHDIDYIEDRSKGRWRIFSKLGLGSSGQFANVGYACLPVLDDHAQPVPGWGRELVIAAHLPSGGASWAERDRRLAKAYRAVISRVVDGRL